MKLDPEKIAEQERHRFECESREWVSLARCYGLEWWRVKKQKLIKIRGSEYMEKLIAEMKRQAK